MAGRGVTCDFASETGLPFRTLSAVILRIAFCGGVEADLVPFSQDNSILLYFSKMMELRKVLRCHLENLSQRAMGWMGPPGADSQPLGRAHKPAQGSIHPPMGHVDM